MKRSSLMFLLLGCFTPVNAQQPRFQTDTENGKAALVHGGPTSTTNASAAPRTPNLWLDSGDSSVRLFLGSRAAPHALNIGVARVGGNLFLGGAKAARSKIELVLCPADAGGPTGLDGKLANARSPNAVDYSELIFKSERIARAKDGALTATGNLTLVRVERSVDATPNEAYAGPIYGEPVVHTIRRQVAFILRRSATDHGVRQDDGLELSASASIPHEDFPGLRSAILQSDWPVVVNNEQCQVPANVGEDYAGPSCTGKTVSVKSQALTPTGLGEDYHGFEGAPPTGSRVTIDFSLVMVPAASSLSEGRKSGGGGHS
jgi:polyisoprenoid-binding protein YceI